jgi:predicted  nucleic acid-binding Zn-ribbon protein
MRQEYEARINEITQENKRVVDKYNALVGEYETTKNQLSQLQIDYRSLEDKINQLNHEIKLRDIAITDKDKRIAELEKDKQILQKKLETSERDLFNLRQDYEGKNLTIAFNGSKTNLIELFKGHSSQFKQTFRI